MLNVFETAELLRSHGISVPVTRYAKSLGTLLENASTMSFPLVLKVASMQASHKTERGLVQLGITDLDELVLAFKQVRKKSVGLAIDALVLQEQVTGVEFIIGGKKDAVFGETVLFGSGGILTELVGDYSLRVCPLSESDALDLISETKAAAFFKGFRGKKASKHKILSLLMKTSALLEENKNITELDFNPVIASLDNAWVVDARLDVVKA